MQRFHSILCIVESDATGPPALSRAIALARRHGSDLTVAAIVPGNIGRIRLPTAVGGAGDLNTRVMEQRLGGLEALITPHRGGIKIATRVLIGTPFLAIIREVLHNPHDLVIKAPESPDWLDHLFGSDDMHLLRKCPCPVWMVKPGERNPYRAILAAVDVDDEVPPAELTANQALNRQTLEIAQALALTEDAELHIAHVWQAIAEHAIYGAFMDTPEQKVLAYVEQVRQHHKANLDDLVRQVLGGSGRDRPDRPPLRTHLVRGEPRREIAALAGRVAADLLIMGTVAHTGIPGFFMGTTAESVLGQIDCSVLALKPPGFETPVTLEG